MKEEKIPHTRSTFTGGDGGWGDGQWGKLWSPGGEHSHRGAEGKVERFPHRGSVPKIGRAHV